MLCLTALLFVTTLAAQDPDVAPPEDPEVAALARLRQSSRERCEDSPRPGSETLEACVDRRTNAMLATYGSAIRAPAPLRADPPLTIGVGLDTAFEQALAASYETDAPREARATVEPRQRCERQSSEYRDDYESSRSFSITCTSGDDANGNAARDLLDSLMDRRDRTSPY